MQESTQNPLKTVSKQIPNSESIEITFKTLSVEAFYFKNHQEIYKTIIFMYKNKLPIDIFTLSIFLQDNGLLKKIGGIKVLIELINQIPNLVYLEEYIRLIKDKSVRRSLIKLGYETINSGYITNISLATSHRYQGVSQLNITNISLTTFHRYHGVFKLNITNISLTTFWAFI